MQVPSLSVFAVSAQTTAQLTAKVAPDDADQAVTWASSDDKVVTVDKTGKWPTCPRRAEIFC